MRILKLFIFFQHLCSYWPKCFILWFLPSIHIACKTLMCYMFLLISTQTTHCVLCVIKDNGWLMHTERLDICCVLQGEFWGILSPWWEVLGCGKLQLGFGVETAALKHCFTLCYIIFWSFFFFVQPHQTARGEACTRTGLVDFWVHVCPESFEP